MKFLNGLKNFGSMYLDQVVSGFSVQISGTAPFEIQNLEPQREPFNIIRGR